jgi:hypothetical protein
VKRGSLRDPDPDFGPNLGQNLGPKPGPNPGPDPALEPGPDSRLYPGLEPAPDSSLTRDPPLKNSKLLKLPSFNPPQLINILTIGRLKEGSLQNPGAFEPEPVGDPLKIYQELTGLRPRLAQKKAVEGAISDPDLWRESVDHWLAHRWSPKNIPGMLNLYNRGGPSHCRYCSQDSESEPETIYQEVLEQLKHGKR